MKATFKGATRDNSFGKGWEHTELHYEYRGYEYIVTKDNNGCMGDTLKEQHRKAQEEIDNKIAHKDDPIPEWKYEGSSQEGFDLFWEFVEK